MCVQHNLPLWEEVRAVKLPLHAWRAFPGDNLDDDLCILVRACRNFESSSLASAALLAGVVALGIQGCALDTAHQWTLMEFWSTPLSTLERLCVATSLYALKWASLTDASVYCAAMDALDTVTSLSASASESLKFVVPVGIWTARVGDLEGELLPAKT